MASVTGASPPTAMALKVYCRPAMVVNVIQSSSAAVSKVRLRLVRFGWSNAEAVVGVSSSSNVSADRTQPVGVGVGVGVGVSTAVGMGVPATGCGTGVGVAVGVGGGVGGWPLSTHTSRLQPKRSPVVSGKSLPGPSLRPLSLTSRVHTPLLALPSNGAKLLRLGRNVPPSFGNCGGRSPSIAPLSRDNRQLTGLPEPSSPHQT